MDKVTVLIFLEIWLKIVLAGGMTAILSVWAYDIVTEGKRKKEEDKFFKVDRDEN